MEVMVHQGARQVKKQSLRGKKITEKRMNKLKCQLVYIKSIISEIITKEHIWKILKTNRNSRSILVFE